MTSNVQSILWRRLDRPGHESARLSSEGPDWHLAGTSVFAHDRQPCRLNYVIICDGEWQTMSGRIDGWVGDQIIKVEVSVDAAHHWRLNGEKCPNLAGCTDIDLNFSPSTNLLPIRRLRLRTGQAAEVSAAWLRFPSFALERLDQRYTRLDDSHYKYESAGGSFTTELNINKAGFVTEYPGFWLEESFQDEA